MSPGKPAKAIKIKVPRHGSQRIGLKFAAHVEALARKEKVRVVTHQPNCDSNNAVAQAIVSAILVYTKTLTLDVYNSGVRIRVELVAYYSPCRTWAAVGRRDSTVRCLAISYSPANRKLFRFLVDHGSDLYYDPSPLMEYQKQEREEENAARAPIQAPDFRAHDPSRITRNHSTSSNQNYPYASPSMSQVTPRHPNYGGYSNVPFNGIPPSHFYGSGADASPIRMGMRDSMGTSMSPDVRRRSARGIPEDGFIQLHGP